MNQPSEWDRFQRELMEWADGVFGADAPLERLIDHIKEELDEVQADPNDRVEWADVLIMIMHGALRSGHTMTEILTTARDVKFPILKQRKWSDRDANGIRRYEGSRRLESRG